MTAFELPLRGCRWCDVHWRGVPPQAGDPPLAMPVGYDVTWANMDRVWLPWTVKPHRKPWRHFRVPCTFRPDTRGDFVRFATREEAVAFLWLWVGERRATPVQLTLGFAADESLVEIPSCCYLDTHEPEAA